MPTSSQLRNALAYMSITVLVLVFLNIYSARATRDLMFKAKCSSSQDKLKVVTSSFSGVDALTQETTEQIISVIGDMNVTRLLVTDAAGRTLYDSVPGQSAAGKMVLLQQVVQALEGNDVFCCVYEDHTLKSYAAAPILTHDTVVGCVYMMEYDASQGGIIASLERTIFRGSLVLIGILFLCAVVFSMTGSERMRQILTSMRLVREGEYSHKIQMRGSDEYATLATEFNKLTDKLQQTEITERQFVSDASHELKTPLASIKLLSDSILQNEMDVDTMREFVADIGAESDRLTRMAQKLLTLSRASADETEGGEHEVVDVGRTLSRVFRMLVPLADRQTVELTASVEKGCTILSLRTTPTRSCSISSKTASNTTARAAASTCACATRTIPSSSTSRIPAPASPKARSRPFSTASTVSIRPAAVRPAALVWAFPSCMRWSCGISARSRSRPRSAKARALP